MTWVRILVGAVWLNGGLEKLLNPAFPRQFAASLEAGGFISQAPPFFQGFMQDTVVPNAELFAQLMRGGADAGYSPDPRLPHEPRGPRQHSLERRHYVLPGRRPARQRPRGSGVPH